MSLVPPALLQRLARSKLTVRRAVASTGVGERRSRAKGVGVEFADHRPYQLGDDIRHLDQHVYARLGEHHIRQFSLYQQLRVTLLIDTSASMRFGQPGKLGFAKSITAGLAYVGLAGGDSVQVGAFASGRLLWSPTYHGVRRANELFGWLHRLEPRQTTQLAASLQRASRHLKPGSLLIIVSDWLGSDLREALKVVDSKQQELVAVQVLAPEEEEPERLGNGSLQLVDAETGGELEVVLDDATLKRYREHLEAWSGEVRDAVRVHQGHFFRVRTDSSLESVLLRDWRGAGLIT